MLAVLPTKCFSIIKERLGKHLVEMCEAAEVLWLSTFFQIESKIAEGIIKGKVFGKNQIQ